MWLLCVYLGYTRVFKVLIILKGIINGSLFAGSVGWCSVFQDGISLTVLAVLETRLAFNSKDPPASAPQVLGLKECTSTSRLIYRF